MDPLLILGIILGICGLLGMGFAAHKICREKNKDFIAP
jgi:hypothetical protein